MFKCVILILGISLIVVSTVLANSSTPSRNIGWGGGGAFTSTTEFNDSMYLASDVTGVWKQVNGHWQAFVEGLGNYNVTALVSFNHWLFAITTDELFVTNGVKPWLSTHIKLSTNRSVTDQVYSVSDDNKKFCIANRNQKIDCIDTHNHSSSYSTPEKIINGVYFDKTDNNSLYFYSGAKLFILNLSSKAVELKKNFSEDIVSITTVNDKALIATRKKVFTLDNLQNKVLDIKKNIINFFVANDGGDDVAIISTGNKWHTKLEQFALIEGELKQQKNVRITFDLNLPHRPYQKSLTKLLSVNQINGETWVTDFWGVYQLNFGTTTTLLEVTDNAINTVATDLAITDSAIYISTMDNGIIKMSPPNVKNEFPEYTALAFNKLKGHSWSLLHHDKSIYGVISPWDSPDDFLFEYSEIDEKSKVTKLADYKTRKSKGAFWGNAYSRQLVYYHDILSFRDGKTGGLVKSKGSKFESIEPSRLGHLNKVYRTIAVHNDLLYIASCEKPRVLAIDKQGELKVLEDLPSGFCPFTFYPHQDSLYLLGARKGQSVIYQLGKDDFGLLQSTKKGDAFYQMAINPLNSQQLVTATISWSKKATSGLFVSNDGGKSFVDKSCLLSHKNGVAAINFDHDTVYVLQKVGGLLALSIDSVFSTDVCL